MIGSFDVVKPAVEEDKTLFELMKEGQFENPLATVHPGKKKPDNLGRGLFQAPRGSCSDLVLNLEQHATLHRSVLRGT